MNAKEVKKSIDKAVFLLVNGAVEPGKVIAINDESSAWVTVGEGATNAFILPNHRIFPTDMTTEEILASA